MQTLVWMEWVEDDTRVCGGRFIPAELPSEPKRVWTLFKEQNKNSIPSLPIIPVHHENAFIEDRTHDWTWNKGKFHYYTRVMDCSCWILLEY